MSKRILGMALAGFLGLSAAGCYGPFKLTKGLHQWNGGIEGKWPREGVFLLMCVVPVYPFAALADGILFNSIEFWTGSNPLDQAGAGQVSGRDGEQAVLIPSADGRTLEVRGLKDGRAIRSFRIESRPDGTSALLDAKGRAIMFSRSTADGGIRMEDAAGRQIALYSAEEAAAALSALR